MEGSVDKFARFLGIKAETGNDLVIAATNPDCFTVTVFALLGAAKVRRSVGRRAREVVETNYRWHNILALLEEFCQRDDFNPTVQIAENIS